MKISSRETKKLESLILNSSLSAFGNTFNNQKND